MLTCFFIAIFSGKEENIVEKKIAIKIKNKSERNQIVLSVQSGR